MTRIVCFFQEMRLYHCLILVSVLTFTAIVHVQAEDSFLPTWKLLKEQERQQFIAGYMFGWSDAAKVTDVAIQFVRENPTNAVEGLTKIRSLYDFKGLKADSVARQLDSFFSQPENRDATLSQAITAVRSELGR